MKIIYDNAADMMYIELSEKPVHKNQVTGNGLVVLDLAEDGSLVSIELISPSEYVDNPAEIVYALEASQRPLKPVDSE